MVEIVTGSGLGLERTSALLLGGAGTLGDAATGTAGVGVTVNADTGDLIVRSEGETLDGVGASSELNAVVSQTYNSLGQLSGTNNTGLAAQGAQIVNVTGPLNTAGGTVQRIGWDGSLVTYGWNASFLNANGTTGAYVAKEGTGPDDSLTNKSGTWVWSDGATGVTETYGNSGGGQANLVSSRTDLDGNTESFTYTGNLLTRMTTADGEYVSLIYSGNNLVQLSTYRSGGAELLTRTYYGYDSQNRLTTTTVDLGPNDNSIADGNVYTTSYAYIGTSNLIASISQTDGSKTSFTYDSSNRVATVTRLVSAGVGRTTSLAYGAGTTTITDPLGNQTVLKYNGSGILTDIIAPPAVAGGNVQITEFAYDANNNLANTSVYDGQVNYNAGVALTRTYNIYDGNGNLLEHRDASGATTDYTYNSRNQVLTSTSYTGNYYTSLTGAETSYYVYDTKGNLGFTVSPLGDVTYNAVNAQGQTTSTLTFTNAPYTMTGLSASAPPSYTALTGWLAGLAAAQNQAVERTDYTYDFRGNLASEISYSATDAYGNGLLTSAYTKTSYVYDQAGELLQKLINTGGTTVIGNSIAQWYGSGANAQSIAAINGQSATEFSAIAAATNAFAYPARFNVQAGDSVTTKISVQGVGSTTSVSLGVYGWTSLWNLDGQGSAIIVSGPGTITPSQYGNGLWTVTGLSSTQLTTIELTRTFSQAQQVGINLYANLDHQATGDAFIATAPTITQDHNAVSSSAYDGLGRIIEQTDAVGNATWTTYQDALQTVVKTLANGLLETDRHDDLGELISSIDSRGGPTSGNIAPTLPAWISQWVTPTATSNLVAGAPATNVTVNSGQTYGVVYTTASVNAGDTLTYSVSLQAVGTLGTQALGLDGGVSGYGYNNSSTVRIVDGPGTLSQGLGGLWYISGLSATQATRVEITRTYTQADTALVKLWVFNNPGQTGATMAYADLSVVRGSYAANQSMPVNANANVPFTNTTSWAPQNLQPPMSAGTLSDGSVATQYLVQTSGLTACLQNGFAVNAGDTVTASAVLMAAGGGTSAALGIYGASDGWGNASASSARIISGPGALVETVGGLWSVTGLSASQETRIEITRTFQQAETGWVLLYPNCPNGFTAGQGVIAGDPSITITPGSMTSYIYDAEGNLRVSTDPAGVNTYYFYDADGRKAGEVDGAGYLTEYKYDAENRVVATVTFGTPLTAAQLASLAPANGVASSVTLSAIQPAASPVQDNWNWNVYNAAGQMVETINAVGTVTSFSHDGTGALTSQTTYANQLTTTQLASFQATPPSAPVLPAASPTLDRTTRDFYNADGLLVGTLDAQGYLSQIDYDSAGRKIDTIAYANAPTVSTGAFAQIQASVTISAQDQHSYYIYDNRGLLTATIDPVGNVTSYTYTASGELASETTGQQVTANTAYTLATLPAAPSGLETTAYTYDGQGRG